MISVGPGMRDCICISQLGFDEVKRQLSEAKEVTSPILGIKVIVDEYLPANKAVMFDRHGNMTILTFGAVEDGE